jgi:hypothetical protein
MLYESQGIFPEGWAFDFRQEARSVTHQHATSARSRTPKAKREADCEQCGKTFIVKRKALGKFCSRACNYASKKRVTPDWMECSRCFAKAGIGMTLGARLLRTSKKQIHEFWKREGISAQLPKGVDSWRRYAQRAGAFKFDSFLDHWWGKYAKDWMSEYDTNFFDWSCIATHEMAKKKSREYQSMMFHTSPKNSNFRLKKTARSRIYNAIKRLSLVKKPGIRYRTEKMIGCKIEQLRSHLESQFKKGMTWNNHGSHWHIDHIIPMSHFDLTKESQLLAASHYTNMQPMWAAENFSKSDTLQQNTQMQLRICATH